MWQKRLTQAEVAESLGLNISTFKSYFRCLRSVPMKVVADLALLLGCDAYRLIGPTDPKKAAIELTAALGVTPSEYADYCDAA